MKSVLYMVMEVQIVGILITFTFCFVDLSESEFFVVHEMICEHGNGDKKTGKCCCCFVDGSVCVWERKRETKRERERESQWEGKDLFFCQLLCIDIRFVN